MTERKFKDTKFNYDCPHHGLFFPDRPTHCPYCGAESHANYRLRVWSFVSFVGVLVFIYFWAWVWSKGPIFLSP